MRVLPLFLLLLLATAGALAGRRTPTIVEAPIYSSPRLAPVTPPMFPNQFHIIWSVYLPATEDYAIASEYYDGVQTLTSIIVLKTNKRDRIDMVWYRSDNVSSVATGFSLQNTLLNSDVSALVTFADGFSVSCECGAAPSSVTQFFSPTYLTLCTFNGTVVIGPRNHVNAWMCPPPPFAPQQPSIFWTEVSSGMPFGVNVYAYAVNTFSLPNRLAAAGNPQQIFVAETSFFNGDANLPTEDSFWALPTQCGSCN